MEILGDCANVADCGEILNQRIARGLGHRRLGAPAVVSFVNLNLETTAHPFAVIKLHFNHLARRGVSLDAFLERFPSGLYVLLYREDLLQQYCSWKLASNTRQFYAKIRDAGQRVHVDLCEWEHFREETLRTYDEACIALCRLVDTGSSRVVVVSYEQLVANDLTKLKYVMKEYGAECNFDNRRPGKLVKQERRQIQDIIHDFPDTAPLLGETRVKLTNCFERSA